MVLFSFSTYAIPHIHHRTIMFKAPTSAILV
jgi:hypothetical protein